jgi:hypothetical protein
VSSNYRGVVPWRPKALTFIELPVDNVKSQGFNVSSAVHLLSKTSYSKKLSFFSFVGVFQRSVTHSRVALAAHKAVTIKARACCMRVSNFGILACIILVVASIYKVL